MKTMSELDKMHRKRGGRRLFIAKHHRRWFYKHLLTRGRGFEQGLAFTTIFKFKTFKWRNNVADKG